MRKSIYDLPGTIRVLFAALITITWLASCSSTKHSANIVSASQINPIPQEASPPVVGAAAQSQSTSSAQASQSDVEDEILASTSVTTPATVSSHTSLKEKLGQLNNRLTEVKSSQAVKGEVKSRKLSFPAKLLVKKLMNKASHLSQKNTAQIGAQEATQDSNSTLLIVGLLIVIIGLLLTLLSTGTPQTIGVISLIVGVVLSILVYTGSNRKKNTRKGIE